MKMPLSCHSDVGRLPVTVVVPALNEERNLPRCLSRLTRFARTIVVDSGSTDRTADIARDAGVECLQFTWNGRYPKKRNWVLLNHEFTTPWVLFLDADEYVTPAFVDELYRLLPGTTHAGFWLRYSNHFLGKRLRHGAPMRKLAMIRVGAGLYERIDEDRWSGLDMEVHEHPIVTGTVGEIRAEIEHDDFRGLHAYIARHNDYSSWEAARYTQLQNTPGIWVAFTPRQRWKYRSLTRWWLAPAYFLASYVWRLGFLDGSAGFAFAFLKAVYFFQIRHKILERQRSGAP